MADKILITTANVVGALCARDYKGVGSQYVAENKLIVEQSIVFYGNRVDDIRIQDDKVNTLQARMGTGGNNMPLVATIFSHTQGLDAQPSETVSPTLRAGGAGMAVAYPIQDGRDIEKKQNGLGVGSENDPSYTLDRTGGQSVAYPIQGTIIGRSDTAGPQGKGYGNPGDPMFTIDTVGGHGVAVTYSPSGFADYSEGMGTLKAGMTNNNSPLVAVDEYNGSTDETHHTLRANKHSTGVMNDMTVRRLTPIECERLQGFPDNWTEGQSDSARYKQMGNAVAVPVVEWIIGNICDTLKEAE